MVYLILNLMMKMNNIFNSKKYFFLYLLNLEIIFNLI